MSLQTIEHSSSFLASFIGSGVDCKTYYKRIVSEDTKSKTSNACPLVIVSGGPLLSHDYCIPLGQLARDPNISYVVLYDPIGCGKSTHIDGGEKNFKKEFWRLTLYQLEKLIDDLNVSASGVYLFGHSLGSVIASSYAAGRTYIKALILSASTACVSDLVQANLELLKTFPADVSETIIGFEEFCKGQRSTPVPQDQYLTAVEVFRNKHFNRNTQPSEHYKASVAACMEVFDVYATIAGGTIMFLWDSPVTDNDTRQVLPQISAPTLVIKGEYDQCLPSCQEPFLKLIPNVREVTLKDASHMVMEEVPERLMEVISEFIAGL